MPTLITAVRHGETDWNVSARIQGHIDIPLNPRGLAQAQRTAAALAHSQPPLHAIYASDLQRAHATAAAIAQATGAPLRSEAGLRERCFGSFEGQTFAQTEAAHPSAARRWRMRDPDFAPPDGGESLNALRARVRRTLDGLAAAHAGQHIALVAHGGIMDMLYRLATDTPVQARRDWPLDNAAIQRLVWTPHSLRIQYWGDTRHLDDLPPARDEVGA